MTSTVIISTYNGSKYIIEQLKSIMNQSEKPDEVLICDDSSSDNTVPLIQDFIKKNNLSSWKLFINEENIGWKKNFFKLMQLSTSDITFLCDQDDFWNQNKIKYMLSIFSNTKINVLCCEYVNKDNIHFYDDTKSSKEELNLSLPIPYLFSQKFMYVKYPGCTYAFRNTYLEQIKTYWKENFPHDAFLFRNAELDDSLYILKLNLLTRRIHDSNASINHAGKTYFIDLAYYSDVCKSLLQRLEQDETISQKEIKEKIIKNELIKISVQKKSINQPKIIYFFKILKFYNTYIDFKAFAKEVLFAKLN